MLLLRSYIICLSITTIDIHCEKKKKEKKNETKQMNALFAELEEDKDGEIEGERRRN